jgi:hypothetical protein
MLITPTLSRGSANRPSPGLRGLDRVTLSVPNQRMLDAVSGANGGDPAWRVRKRHEARDLLALSQIAPPDRLAVQMLDLRTRLRARLKIKVPVACRPDGTGDLHVADHALLGLVYPREVLHRSLPGASFVQILQPRRVWNANVAPGEQALCLAVALPCNIPAREIVVMAYDALAMLTYQVDEFDEAGVFNVEAARWWAANLHRLPLTTSAFLQPGPE